MDGQEVEPLELAVNPVALLRQTLDSWRTDNSNKLLADNVQAFLADIAGETKAWKAYKAVEQAVYADFVFAKVDTFRDTPELYVWYKNNREDGGVFRPFDEVTATELLTRYYAAMKLRYSADQINTAVKTLRNTVQPRYPSVPYRVIKVSKNYYWDSEKAWLMSTNSQTDAAQSCFRSLFDSPAGDINISLDDIHISPYEVNAVKALLMDREEHDFPSPQEFKDAIVPYFSSFSERVYGTQEEFAINKTSLVTHAGQYEAALQPFWDWADGDRDTYNDLLLTFVAEFQYVKPKLFFYFIGDTRNGKSAAQKLRRTLLGSRNTSTLSASETCSWDYSLQVAQTMSNAPDEDSDFDPKTIESDLKTFKAIVSHDSINLRMKNKSSAIEFRPNFLNILPRNKMPDFNGGDGLQAVLGSRMRAIQFKHDFSSSDNRHFDFEKETYTPKFFSALIPVLLGGASYYTNGEPLRFSKTCMQFCSTVNIIADPASAFVDELVYWFDYVNDFDFITKQAIMFFKENGIQYGPEMMKAVKEKISRLDEARISYSARERCGSVYTDTETNRKRSRRLRKNKERKNRIKMFAPDAKIAALGEKSPEEYYSTEFKGANGDVSSISVPSILSVLRDLEANMVHPEAMQQQMLNIDSRIATASIDEQGNLIDTNGDIIDVY